MRTVYGANGSPFVRKVCVMLAEKGLTYEQEPVIPLNVSAEFKKLSPLGKIPAYRDGEATLSDSSIICAYLERKHPEPPLYPAEPFEYARALWFEEYGDTVDAKRWPKLAGYVAGVHARPSFKRLIEAETAFFGTAA